MPLNVAIIDGHPDRQRLVSHLLDHYQAALQQGGAAVARVDVRDLNFEPNLGHGYSQVQAWEADLQSSAKAISACDHLVVGFPLWWGAEPACLKAFLDRVILPGFAFKYHRENLWWDKLMTGRSADVIVTMDTPPWYLQWVYGDPVMKRWRSQILGFCGFQPIRTFRFGPTRRGAAKRGLASWESKVARAAETAFALPRPAKQIPSQDPKAFQSAIDDRMS